jgi:putative DNA primase/helicase
MLHRALVFLVGVTACGKSVVIDTVLHILHDYGTKLPKKAILMLRDPGGNSQDTARAMLHRRRGAFADELSGRPLDPEALKEIGSKGKIDARRLYRDPIVFRNTAKLFMASNNHPVISDMGGAVWDRLRVIKFEGRFVNPTDEDAKHAGVPGKWIRLKDNRVEARMLEEASGILNWLLEGCKEWYRLDGIVGPPQSVREASREYEEDMDWRQKFIADEIVKDENEESRVTTAEAFERFKTWAKNRNQLTHMSHDTFVRDMVDAGLVKGRPRIGETRPNCFVGVRLVERGGVGAKVTAGVDDVFMAAAKRSTTPENPGNG